MTAVWAHRPPPAPLATRTAPWHGHPTGLAQLTELRRRLRRALHSGRLPAGADDGERLLLVFEELVSNALRHGRPPVHVTVTPTGSSWLLAVSDAAVERPPTPEPDRDPAHGGMGLPLVAQICGARGWAIECDSKVVWAQVPHREAIGARRVHEASDRAVALAARLTATAARVAVTLDALAAAADAAGRPAAARSHRGAAARARERAERARKVAGVAAPAAASPAI